MNFFLNFLKVKTLFTIKNFISLVCKVLHKVSKNLKPLVKIKFLTPKTLLKSQIQAIKKMFHKNNIFCRNNHLAEPLLRSIFFVNMNKAFLNILHFKLLSNLQISFVIHFFSSEDSNICGLYKPRSVLKNVRNKSNNKILNVSLKKRISYCKRGL